MKNSNKFSNNNEKNIASYKKGDFVGQKYEVYGVLGKGGFGIVYLVYSHNTGDVYASIFVVMVLGVSTMRTTENPDVWMIYAPIVNSLMAIKSIFM